jgi:AmmeMemoRadiSam system protein B
MSTRPTAVAGLFYEGDAAALRDTVDRLLSNAGTPAAERPRALVVPHAGYLYSGSTAARAYAGLRPFADSYRRVVLLGPAHRVFVQGIAIPSVEGFATPLGPVPLDRAGLDDLTTFPAVTVSDEAHREEHSLEVQLPFLQRVLGDFVLLPLLVGRCPPDAVAEVVDALWDGPETLFVLSSDLSHFHDYAAADRLDANTCQRILAGVTDLSGEEACGAAPLNGFFASRSGGSLQRELLQRCNSGDTAGDRRRVVGYAAFRLS